MRREIRKLAERVASTGLTGDAKRTLREEFIQGREKLSHKERGKQTAKLRRIVRKLPREGAGSSK